MSFQWYKDAVYRLTAREYPYTWVEYEWRVQNWAIFHRAIVHGAERTIPVDQRDPDKGYRKRTKLYTSSWHDKESQCRDQTEREFLHGIPLRSEDIIHNNEISIPIPIINRSFFNESANRSGNNLFNIVDKSRVVIVCISGYQFSSSRFTKQNFIEQMKETNNITELSNVDYDIAYENLCQLSSSEAGMKKMREKFVQDLSKLGVPSDNIIYSKWTEGSEMYNRQPVYNDLVRRINKLNPSYLAILGHSYGGCATIRITQETNRVPDFIGLIDPIFIPASVFSTIIKSAPQDSRNDNYPRGDKIINWYQNNGRPYGFEPILDNHKREVKNIHVDGVIHTTIDEHEGIYRDTLNHIIKEIKLSKDLDGPLLPLQKAKL
jgi:hypothetical protein